jgi:hypothetical protein
MRVLKYWAFSLAIDGLALGLFYLWQAKGMAGAGNALSFVIWWHIIMRTIAAFAINKETVAKNPRPSGFVQYHFVTEVAVVIGLAWVGYTWTAVCYSVASVFSEGARLTEPKPKKQVSESK